MKLADLKVSEFVDLVSSKTPAPGGGSVAAMEGAVGSALAAMVCNLTNGKKKYEEFEDQIIEVEKKVIEFKDRFMDVMQRDTEAFNVVSEAFSMPKDTEEQKENRSKSIQNGLKVCTETPFEMMGIAVEVLELIDSIIDKSNNSAISDMGVAALSLRTAIQGAWLNVLINIESLKDKNLAEDYRVKGETMLCKGVDLAEKIYSYVLTRLQE